MPDRLDADLLFPALGAAKPPGKVGEAINMGNRVQLVGPKLWYLTARSALASGFDLHVAEHVRLAAGASLPTGHSGDCAVFGSFGRSNMIDTRRERRAGISAGSLGW
jgi:hypothetical protein